MLFKVVVPEPIILQPICAFEAESRLLQHEILPELSIKNAVKWLDEICVPAVLRLVSNVLPYFLHVCSY